MKTLKKALSVVLGLAIMLTCLFGMQVSVAAEGNTLALTVGSVTAAPGDTVIVPVKVTSTGFRALGIKVTYDDGLTLTAADKVAITTVQDAGAQSKDVTVTPYVMQWAFYQESGADITANDATIANLTFQVDEEAAEGSYNVKVEVTEAWDAGNGAGYTAVATTVTNGVVTVEEEEPAGPVEDTSLVVRDALVSVTEALNARIRVRRTVVQNYARAEIVITPTGYSSTYNEQQEEEIVTSFDVQNDTTANYAAWYNNIGMYELDLPFTVQIKCYDEDDNYVAYSPIVTYKTTDLLKAQYNESATTEAAQKLNVVVTDMLNMGAAAQTYFASTTNASGSQLKALVDAGDLMNKGWTGVGSTTVPELRQDGSLTFGEGYSATTNRTSISVDLSGAPALSYLIRDISGYTDWSKLKLTVSYRRFYDQADGGAIIEDVIEGDEWEALTNASRNRFTYKFSSCAMYDANKLITATLTYDGNEVFTSVYSLENCLYDTLGTNEKLNNALNSVATFSAAVRAYFATRGTVDAA